MLFRSFRDSKRPSVGVAAMNEIAGGLSDAETLAIGHYLAHFAAGK